ncbi:MAG: methyltransferase domain-containing protein [Deltaproteobacteria bacterium]|nr:methyltransferase domain-containing protein [Deltaproteobacteria bacterium]
MLWWKPRRQFRGTDDFASDADFLECLYRLVLGRRPDEGGFSHHLQRLTSGEANRVRVLRDFLTSPECSRFRLLKFPVHHILQDYVPVADPALFQPYVQAQPLAGPVLCELANPRKWLDPEWFATLLEMPGMAQELETMHRKTYEFVQTIYGLRHLGGLGPDSRVLSVGAGHDYLLYWLANRVGQVVATDLYEGAWSTDHAKEGDPDVLEDPTKYAPFDYRQDHLTFLKMDGRKLEFPDQSFDAIYSLSSIEHFGGPQGTAQAMAEMGRVLRPGGLAAIATEMVVNGQPHEETFLPQELVDHVVAPSGLKLVQLPVFELPSYTLEHPIDLPEESEFRPHLLLRVDNTLFTSVMLLFVKE